MYRLSAAALGGALIVAGVAAWSWPAGLIVAGLELIVAAIIADLLEDPADDELREPLEEVDL